MGDVLAFARFAHAVALHGLGQDHGRLAGMLGGRRVSRIDFLRVVTAAIQMPDLLIRHVGDHLQQFGIFAEEVLAHICTVF